MLPEETADSAIQEDRLWREQGWTARVIKNPDDEGWAVEMIKQGQDEPALVAPASSSARCPSGTNSILITDAPNLCSNALKIA